MARLLVDHWWTRALADVQIVRIRRSVERFELVPEWNFGGWDPLTRAPGSWLRYPRQGTRLITWPDLSQSTVRFPPQWGPDDLDSQDPGALVIDTSSDSDDDVPVFVRGPHPLYTAYPLLAPPVGRASIRSRALAIMFGWRGGHDPLVGELWAAGWNCWVERMRWVGDSLLGWGGRFLTRTLFAARIGFHRVLRGVWPFWI